MSDYEPPKDGDFIAYIDRLQQESAARLQLNLLLDSHDSPAKAARAGLPESAPRAQHETPPAKFAPAVTAAAEIRKTLSATPSAARLVVGGFGVAAGVYFLMDWLMFKGGVLSLLIGIGLLAWAVPRLRSAKVPAHEPGSAASRASVEHWFGNRPK